MKLISTTFGLPDTLPPLGRRELRGCFVFAGMGLFVLLAGLFPNLRPPPRMALPMALCFLALPAWGLFRYLTRKRRTGIKIPAERVRGTSTQVGLYAAVMVGVGFAFFFWARRLGVSSTIIFGSLLLIEGLGGVIVSLTEWWRLSHIGVSLGLIACGFLLPFVDKTSLAVPVGAAFLSGSLMNLNKPFGCSTSAGVESSKSVTHIWANEIRRACLGWDPRHECFWRAIPIARRQPLARQGFIKLDSGCPLGALASRRPFGSGPRLQDASAPSRV